MRSFFIKQAVGAGVTVDVINAQGINGFFGKAAAITVYGNTDTSNTMTQSLNSDDGTGGIGLIPSGSAIKAASTAGAIKNSEDFIGQFGVNAGSKVTWLVTNPTGGSLNFNGLVVVQ